MSCCWCCFALFCVWFEERERITSTRTSSLLVLLLVTVRRLDIVDMHACPTYTIWSLTHSLALSQFVRECVPACAYNLHSHTDAHIKYNTVCCNVMRCDESACKYHIAFFRFPLAISLAHSLARSLTLSFLLLAYVLRATTTEGGSVSSNYPK